MAAMAYLYTSIDVLLVTLQRAEIGCFDNRTVQDYIVGINLLCHQIDIMVADTPCIAVGKGDRRELLLDRVYDCHGGVAELSGAIAALQVDKETHWFGTFEVETRTI